MADIEEYNPFLIGIKVIPGLNLEEMAKEIKDILKSQDYEVPKEQLGLPIKIGLPIEPLGGKNGVEIDINFQNDAFNIRGRKPDDVLSIFKEFLSFFKELKYDNLEEIIPFYEIVSNIGIKTDKNPLEVLTKAANVNLSGMKVFNQNTSVIGIRMGSIGINLEKSDLIEILVEPKKGSHSNRYQIKLRYQTKDLDNIFELPIQEEVDTIISSLEGNL
jgi:hypothetical protein